MLEPNERPQRTTPKPDMSVDSGALSLQDAFPVLLCSLGDLDEMKSQVRALARYVGPRYVGPLHVLLRALEFASSST